MEQVGIILSPVTTVAIEMVWPDVEDFITAAVNRSRGEMTTDDIKEACKEGRMFLAVAHEGWEVYGAVVSEVRQYPRKRALAVPYMGGREFMKWRKQMGDFLVLGAKNIGADFIEALGRKGWSRVFKDYGAKQYTFTSVSL